MTPSPLSLSQFARAVGDAVRREPLTQNAWIIAELSDVRIAGGHCYMELIEKDARGTTTAKMRAMIWAGSLPSLRRKFFQATGRDIAAGLKVMVLGSATHHNVYGLSVNITDIDPSYTLGDIERLRREILERLAKEDIIVDGLVATVGANPEAALECFDTIRYCSRQLGLATICGLSPGAPPPRPGPGRGRR